MNDPWSNLIDTLAGTERKTPTTWPKRNVHRILDDTLTADPQPRSRALRPILPPPVRLATMTPPKGPDQGLRCPCTNCVAERLMRNAA
jgi:hypothetical protein